MKNEMYCFGYDLEIYRNEQIRVPYRLNFNDYTQLLLTGGTGTGKSYALLYLVGSIIANNPNISIYICDFKNSEDFLFLNGYQYYYAGDFVYNGIMNYYEEFTKARQSGESNIRHLLIVDEYPALINYLQTKDKIDKSKKANEVMSAIAEILMLGRGIKFGCLITTQRADSSLFANGARDNFQVVCALGRLSKEQKQMLFSGEEIEDNYIFGKGEGILLADGKPLKYVKFPMIDIAEFKENIRKILMGNSDSEELLLF